MFSAKPSPLHTALRQNVESHLRTAIHVIIVAAPVGIIVGAAISGYDYVVNTVLWETLGRHLSPTMLALMPIIGMILTGIILAVFKVASPSMADEVVRAYHRPDKGIDYKTAIPKLAASVATMGFGCSAGMEGASKWLGATIAGFIQSQLNRIKALRLAHGDVETTLLAGAAAGIGAIFRAPLTGAIMGIESPYKHDLAHKALIHGLVASALSYATFSFLRSSTPYFPIHFTYVINIRDLLFCVPLGLLAGLTSHVFLGTLNAIKRRWLPWRLATGIKYALAGIFISALAFLTIWLVGEPATLQAGLPVANRLLGGQFTLQACLLILVLKLLATAFTFGMGGVGGLFVPSATIGAALGAACDIAFQPSQPGIFTLVGIAAFTGASYNSLLFAAVFVAEASGSAAIVVPGLLASSIAFLVSSGVSNSPSQRSHRLSDDAELVFTPCERWMTKKLIVARPGDSLAHFVERAVTEHHFRELPVVTADGVFQGMASLTALRMIPAVRWPEMTVAEIIDRSSRTVCPTQSMAEVEESLAKGSNNYIPVVDPMTDRVIGILSPTDVLRARRQREKERPHEQAAVQDPLVSQSVSTSRRK